MYLPQTDTEFRNALQDAADLAVKAFAAELEGMAVSIEVVLPKRKPKPIVK